MNLETFSFCRLDYPEVLWIFISQQGTVLDIGVESGVVVHFVSIGHDTTAVRVEIERFHLDSQVSDSWKGCITDSTITAIAAILLSYT